MTLYLAAAEKEDAIYWKGLTVINIFDIGIYARVASKQTYRKYMLGTHNQGRDQVNFFELSFQREGGS